MVEKRFCAQISRDAGDPFIGTAARADTWLLIEYRGAWGRNEIESSELPDQVKSWIDRIQKPHVRTQLIKQDRHRSGHIIVYVAITQEQRQALYRFQFACYEDLLSLDLEALRNGHGRYEDYRYYDPLFLVCTHGKHDACCAKFGMPVYSELERLAGEFTWQSSHVGGDKFAANVLCFPHGIYYGRVAVSEVESIIASYWQLQLYLKKYRGRTCYQPMVQAADYFVRERTGQTDLRAFQLLEVRQITAERWWVSFESARDSTRHCLFLQEQVNEAPPYRTTCHADRKHISKAYHLSSYEILEPGQTYSSDYQASLSLR
ncbi:MAG: hypothetical protein J2P36_13655 [Ktedonobacteraceae bacterium]|nr:hypothetical protein [Ktedonobacteraceae bacterium]